ncbi:MAG TPA: beta-xylosidase [Bryobacteraceae bacterium]
MKTLLAVLLSVSPLIALGQEQVTIRVGASQTKGAFKPVWHYFGYDELNNTDTKNGRKLIHELAALSSTPSHIRAHFLLASGNGKPALKWGSTNVYTEDASGKPVYNWAIMDQVFDSWVHAGVTPYVEVGFMPEALSSHPQPYTPHWKPGDKFNHYALGWTYPPKSYKEWGDLIYHWVEHSIQRYGKAKVETWNWEVWNEPNIFYWHGTPQDYDKLYDYTAAAIKRALPAARVGGPASTSPRNAHAAAFLKQFLEHCASGKNYATGGSGAPLDFISFHAKGHPSLVDGHVEMGISAEMKDAADGFNIVRSFPKFHNLPVFISEADPEGCGACASRVYPANAYRNTSLYPTYEAVVLKTMLQLAASRHIHLKGVLTWAFEMENQPYFEGFRDLATNGIDKPVLNIFRMEGLMRGNLVKAESSGAVPTGSIVNEGVRSRPDVDVLATRSNHDVSILIWNYQDNDVSATAARIDLRISGLPQNAKRVLLRHYRIDKLHSNSYTVWKQMGSPQNPSPAQYKKLESAGQLQLLASPRWIGERSGSAEVKFALPLESVSLVKLSW